MQRFDPPTVRPGQAVTAKLFDLLRRAVYACRLIAGPGVRLRTTPSGTIISFHSSVSVSCSWEVHLRGNTAATVQPGTINGVMAAIDEAPLDGGEEEEPAPVLDFGKPMLNSEGRGFICAEVTCNPEMNWSIVSIEIVQVADPDTEDGSPAEGLPNASGGATPLSGNRARHPLAMLIQRESGRIDVHQIAMHDVTHRVRLAADQKSASRHFFY